MKVRHASDTKAPLCSFSHEVLSFISTFTGSVQSTRRFLIKKPGEAAGHLTVRLQVSCAS